MFWFVYNVLFAIGYGLMTPHFLLRMWRRGGYRKGFLQRFGRYEPELLRRLQERRRIWIHAVSVGEISVAVRFMEELRKAKPNLAFVLTTTTSTGHKVAEAKLNPNDVLLYFPTDFPAIVNRVLDTLNPLMILLTESELWPNLIRKAHDRGIPVVLINGRISESSFKGYRRIRVFFTKILRCLDLMLVQSAMDRQRLVELGADPSAVREMGSVKYDITHIDTAGQDGIRQVMKVCGMIADSMILVGGSTWKGEERVLLDLLKQLKGDFPRLKLVLVPRHAERRAEVEEEIKASGLTHVRRSAIGQAGGGGTPDVLLVDTTGELKNFYALADVIFVGKSLTSKGGQNIIEPAVLGKPVIVGPHMANFDGIMTDFLAQDAIVQVSNEAGLAQAVRSLLSDRGRRETLGHRAAAVVEAKKGAARESVKAILRLLDV